MTTDPHEAPRRAQTAGGAAGVRPPSPAAERPAGDDRAARAAGSAPRPRRRAAYGPAAKCLDPPEGCGQYSHRPGGKPPQVIHHLPGCPAEAGPAGRVYHGAGGHGVSVETAGGAWMRRLHNAGERHSPSGFSWGYGGSGPAALARSVLADALGPLARCPACNGTHRIVWPLDADGPRPWTPDDDRAGPRQMCQSACPECDDGIRHLPYQDYKFEVIAKLPQGGEWRIARGEVLAWLRAYPDTHDVQHVLGGWGWLAGVPEGGG